MIEDLLKGLLFELKEMNEKQEILHDSKIDCDCRCQSQI